MPGVRPAQEDARREPPEGRGEPHAVRSREDHGASGRSRDSAAASRRLPREDALERTPPRLLDERDQSADDILLLRGYDDADTLAAERDAVLRGGDLYGLGDLVVAVEADTWVPFPFTAPVAPGEVGPIFEVRTYLLRPGGLPATIEGWEKALPARLALSPLVTAMYSVSGAMPRFCHVWPYRSLEERQRIRARAVETGVWPPPGGAGRLLAQKTEIFLPARFSPLR